VNRQSYWRKLSSVPPGWCTETSYSKWAKQYKNILGFTDFADFTTCRESRKRHGVLVKPDTYDGRLLIATLKSKSELTLIEKQKWKMSTFKLPKIPLVG
jgi:phage anti-repressor protein